MKERIRSYGEGTTERKTNDSEEASERGRTTLKKVNQTEKAIIGVGLAPLDTNQDSQAKVRDQTGQRYQEWDKKRETRERKL